MLFRKTKSQDKAQNKAQARGLVALSVIARDAHILGALVSDGSIDLDGTVDGNIRCHALTVRKNGNIKGDVNVDALHVYGKINGIINAKNVHLYADCYVEGIIMHEGLIIEDGAFMDGKCKRTDKPSHDSGVAIEEIADVQITSAIRLIS